MLDQRGHRTLGELCELRAVTHPDRPAVRDEHVELTYAQLAARARAVARMLSRRGICTGDRVVVQGANSVAWVVAAYGVLLAGATVVPLGHRVAEGERRRLVDQLQPGMLLLEDGLPGLDTGAVRQAGFAELMALDPEHDGPAVPPWAEPTAPAVVICSSGTSGRVKAVPMTHWQLIRMYDDTRMALDAGADDVWACVVPVTHSFGFNGVLLVAVLAGACVRLVRSYDAEAFARLVVEEGVTVLAGPPTIYHDLAGAAAASGAAPGAGVRLAIVGSTEVSATEMAALARTIGLRRVATGYGMTETCGTVAIGELSTSAEDPLPWMPLMPGVEVRICDADGGVVPPGSRGRLQVRGYNLCRPYAAAPDLEPGGWFDTGDLGELDDAGRLAVTGRIDDLVNVSGFNVHPREVEAVLRGHPAVAEVAVVAVPDARRGQRLVACVVPADPGAPPSTEQLVAHARSALSPYKVPRQVHLLDRLPTTATGKLSRATLRRVVEAGALSGAG